MWYAASLLFKSSRKRSEEPPLWEESIRLIQASSDQDAKVKAERLGKDSEVSFEADGETVTWRFERIERLFSVEEELGKDGIEVFSRHLRDSEVRSLLTPFAEE
jgi:hypothetical protein